MTSVMRALAVLAVMLALLTGCRTMTGRNAGQWVDDKTTTAKVKAALASTRVGTLTRVDVDTYEGTVYLSGMVEDEALKQALIETAKGAANGKPVVSNLAVSDSPAARAESSEAPAASPRTDASIPALTQLKFGRMDPDPRVPGRYAAYDAAGQQVATVFVLPVLHLRQHGIAHLDTGERPVDHVSVYPHPGSDGMQYHLVLWHVSREDAAPLQ